MPTRSRNARIVTIMIAACVGSVGLRCASSAASTADVERIAEPAPPHSPLVGQDAALSPDDASPVARVAPGRIVVKYRHTVDGCVHCIIEQHLGFAKSGGAASLDRLHAELGVTAARPLFFERHGLSTEQARAAFELHVEAVRARQPQRSRRAPQNANVPDLTNVYELTISPDVDVERAAQLYAADASVVYARPLREVKIAYLPDDPFLSSSGTWGQAYEDLWGLFAVNAPAAWDVATGAGVVVAIVDTGVDPSHGDLGANMWTNSGEVAGNGVDDDANGYIDDTEGWDFANDDNDPLDRHGHGTHVAGTAAGVGDDAYGMAGLAYQARIMALKGLSDSGSGYDSNLAEALVYAADNGADVVNNSWGGFGLAEVIYDAIAYADALGVVVVSASGNEAREIDGLLWLPHGHPQGLTVGALDSSGGLASFSNYGPMQSIVAPGVDVLSAKADKEVFDSSGDVSNDWLRLSGTSMASPHAAGAAAVLLSAQPALTSAEVRWQLELNAVQPVGYDGGLHNTTFGYGVLDAGAMFTPAPTTTRLRPPNRPEWHAFAEQRTPPGKPAELSFTALAPEPWTAVAFEPLVTLVSSGEGDAPLDLEIDASTTPAGTYQGDVVVSAPGAIDGGASFAATVHVHDDARLGPPITIGTDGYATLVGYTPQIGASHLSTLAAWQGIESESGLQVSLIDSQGNASAPTPVGATAIFDTQIASDGHEFLLAWRDFYLDEDGAHFVRVGADGSLLDTVPVRAISRRERRGCRYVDMIGTTFDGEDYWIVFNDLKCSGRGKSIIYFARVHRDGSVARPRRVAKFKLDINPILACRSTACMLVWLDPRAEGIDEFNKYIRSAYALPIVAGEAVGDPVKIATDLSGVYYIATDGQDYMAIGRRDRFCAIGDFCRTEVIGIRIDGDTGAPLDPDVLVLSNAAPTERVFPWSGGIAYDGTDYVVSYQVGAVNDSPFDDGSYVFVNRIGADGIPQSTEPIGTLVDSSGRSSQSVIAASRVSTVVFYENGEGDPLEEPYPHPMFTRHIAQRISAREPEAGLFPEVEIGAIGPLALPERGYLRLRPVASGMDPATVVYSASGLPPGAVFDPATCMFEWSPSGTGAGSYSGVEFSATDATTKVTESIQIDVSEAIPTATGAVRLADGTPVGGLALEIRGTADRRRTAYSKADGTFAFEELIPGRKTKIRVGKASKKTYAIAPKQIVFTPVAGDVVLADVIATPK